MISRKDRLVQMICFTLASVLLWPLPFWTSAPKFIAQASPFNAICYCIALRTIGVGTGIGLALAAVGLWRRRFFCRYICPVGLLLDGISHIGPQKVRWWTRCPSLGKYAALLTIGGAAVGYPLLLWMDPLAIFSSFFAIRTAGGMLSGVLAGLGIGALILLSWTSGSVWCSRLCPLGGIQDLSASIKPLFQDQSRAASIKTLSANSNNASSFGSRRFFLFVAAGAGIGFLTKRFAAARAEDKPLRPPGAVVEKSFAGLCLRCSNCVRACPTKIIHPDTGQAGVAGLLAPMIRYEKQYCLEDCNACTQVCPSGALQALDLKQKRRYVIGEALVDMSLCVLALGKMECDACMRACAFDSVHIHWDEEQYIAYPVVDRGKCNGCGACEVACPAYDIKAIRVWKRII